MTALSVVLCTRSEQGEVPCIRSFEQEAFDDFEVIVRRDDGISAARNAGIRAASADKILFVDDDAHPHEDYLQTVVDALDRYDAVGGRVVHPVESPQDELIRSYCEHYDQGDEERETDRLVGCNMAFRREVLDVVGGFDENFDWGHEETDMARRVRRAGFTIGYVPEMCVTHRYASSLPDLWRKMEALGRADAYFDRKKGVSEWERLHWHVPIRRAPTLTESVVASVAAGCRSLGRFRALLSGVPDVPTEYPETSARPTADAGVAGSD